MAKEYIMKIRCRNIWPRFFFPQNMYKYSSYVSGRACKCQSSYFLYMGTDLGWCTRVLCGDTL